MPDGAWSLIGFTEAMETWERNEPASGVLDGIRSTVLNWIMSLHDNPRQGAKCDDQGIWFAEIPRTLHDGQVVCCTYLIDEGTRTVQCCILNTLSWPV